MASSNRHWPSMFKSKPTFNTHQDHQWQPHACHRSSPYSSGCDERTPEPKPRWNPKPEQIRILESIFNSGMVNPPREEIRKIRTKLQEFGQVGDANVFYWFQNRKSRSKNKNRHLHKPQNHHYQPATKVAATSPSSSSSKSSSKSIDFLLNSPTASVNQNGEFFQEPYFFPPMQQPPLATTGGFSQEFCFPELGKVIDQENHQGGEDRTVGSGSGMLLTDLMMNYQNGIPVKNSKSKGVEEENVMKVLSQNVTAHSNVTPSPAPLAALTPMVSFAAPTTTVPSSVNDIEGLEEAGMGKLIVFINDVPFEVAMGPFNVREAFGGDVVLIHSSGETVVTNEWGVTVQSLQHGAFYYLGRSFAPII